MVDLEQLRQQREGQKKRDLEAMAIRGACGASLFPFIRFGKSPKNPCAKAEELHGALLTEHPELPLPGCTSGECLCIWRLVSKSEARKLGK